ncbi:MAG: OmpA family protein, partial [Hyphomicrobiaceae bacterium]|nr:OmpA family protein [Hyphomicrobiaceae bacterium]
KKWKLIIPKKRVVSYRTNRWFAKPRWVAIELTYTQAVKLGLAEARARAPDAPAEVAAGNTASTAQPAIACAAPPSATPPPAGREAPGADIVAEVPQDLSDQVEVQDDQDSADDEFRLAANDDEPEADEPLPQPSPPVPQVETPPPRATVAMQPDEADARVVAFVAQRPQPAAASRPTLRRAVATLAAAFVGYAVWAAFDAVSLSPGPDCAGAEPAAAHCAGPIVTGSIDPATPPPIPASAPVADPPPSADAIAALVPAPPPAPSIAASVPLEAAEEQPDIASPDSPTRDSGALVPSGHDTAPSLSSPVVTAAVAIPQPAAPVAAECDGLGDTGRRIRINFDYASAQLDPAVRAALETFAAALRACPGSMVRIEGHTDSDGRADRNRALSLRRAQAVQQHLVAAGVEPHRLAAIGFGQTRPALPNVSQQNKRNNRRAVLVVAAQR